LSLCILTLVACGQVKPTSENIQDLHYTTIEETFCLLEVHNIDKLRENFTDNAASTNKYFNDAIDQLDVLYDGTFENIEYSNYKNTETNGTFVTECDFKITTSTNEYVGYMRTIKSSNSNVDTGIDCFILGTPDMYENNVLDMYDKEGIIIYFGKQ
jgi:hypothetical protein